MKYFLLFAIKCYWLFIPKAKRKHCIFSESCSNYVYRKTKNQGLTLGLKAFKERFYSCRPGYTIIDIKGELHLISANQKVFNKTEIRSTIISN